MRLWKAASVALLACLLAAPGLYAQAAGALIVKVTDSEGNPLPGAIVKLTNVNGYIAEEAVPTGRDGIARFPVLRAGGGYAVEVSFPSFATRRESDQKVSIGKESTLLIQLSAENVERIKVVATSPVVDLDDSSSSTKFTDEFVSDLPVPGRFYQNVLTLAPGVNDPDGDGNPIVHGSRSRDFQAQVSGVSNVDPFSGQSAALVNPNSIEEMEVITGGASVEFGRAQGGFANIVQKQGTNEFEGVFDFLFRSSVLDGSGANDFSNVQEPDFETFQPSISFSGPIVRDRVWFRLNHDLIDNENPISTGSGIEVTTTERMLNADQITWQASPRNKLQFQFSGDSNNIGNLGVNSLVGSESAFAFERDVETLQFNWTAPYSTRILIDSLVAAQTIETDLQPNGGPGATNDCLPNDILAFAPCANAQSGIFSGPASLSQQTKSERLTVKSQATVYGGQFAGGTHQFKLGFTIENERYFQADFRRPNLTFFEIAFNDDSGQGGDEATVELLRLINANISVPAEADLRATGNAYAFYVEDQYKPFSNVTFTLGARIDREEISSEGALPIDPVAQFEAYDAQFSDCLERFGPGQFNFCARTARNTNFTGLPDVNDFLSLITQSLGVSTSPTDLGPEVAQQAFFTTLRNLDTIDINNTNVSPFFSVKWDPFSNGRTAFSASYRRYFDKIFLNVPLNEALPATTNVLFEVEPNPEGQDGYFIPSPRRARGGIEPAPNISTVDRNLKTPHQDEFIIAFEREVATETSIRVEYVNRKFRDQFQDIDINRVTGDYGRCKVATVTNNSVLEESPGTGFYTDPYTGEQVFDSDPGLGDGFNDDCAGDIVESFGEEPPPDDPFAPDVRLEQPDGVPDLYIQNPAFGSIFFISNFNSSDYEAFVVALNRRQYRSWELQASYTWSFSEGNGEDFQQAFGDDQSLTDDEFGFQSTDQRHIVRMNATTITPWGVRLGGSVRWESGLPYSVQEQRVSFSQVPPPLGGFGGNDSQIRTVYPSGSRNDQRNASFWNVDLKLTKEMNLSRGLNLQFSAEMFNVFNDDTLQVYNPVLEFGRQINGNNESQQRFGRQWQLGVKLAF